MAPNPLLRSRPHAKKTFGKAFGEATGVSDPRLQKIRIRNHCAGGKAATVAGYAGPGFHTWPTGHFLQNTDTIALIRIRRIETGLKRRSVRRSLRRSFRTRACFSDAFTERCPENHILENKCVLKEHRIGMAGVDVRDERSPIDNILMPS
jgi:hypothetical protein